MLHIIAALLGIITVILAVITIQLVKLRHEDVPYVGARLDDIFRAQINPRTRIGGPIKVQSGAVSDEQKLERLGRASTAIGRRIVVGGDDDSQLNKDLTTSVKEADRE